MNYTKPKVFKIADKKVLSASVHAPTGDFVCGFEFGAFFGMCVWL